MSKAPSVETQLRQEKAHYKSLQKLWQEQQVEIGRLKAAAANARGAETQARQEAAEWRKRFDDLLARVPVAAISAEPSK